MKNHFFGIGADSLFYFSVGAWFGMRQIDFIGILRKIRTTSYVSALIMTSVEFYITYTLYIEHGELQFLWIPFNIFVLSMMGATLNLAADWQESRLQRILQKLPPRVSFFSLHTSCSFISYKGGRTRCLIPSPNWAIYFTIGPS